MIKIGSLLVVACLHGQTVHRVTDTASGKWAIVHLLGQNVTGVNKLLNGVGYEKHSIVVTRVFDTIQDAEAFNDENISFSLFPPQDARPFLYASRARHALQSARKAPVVQSIRIGQNVSVINRDSFASDVPDSRFVLPFGGRVEILEINALAQPKRNVADDYILVIFLRAGTASVDIATASYSILRKLVGDTFLRVYVRTDPWFLSVPAFPVHSLALVGKSLAPTWSEWREINMVACEGRDTRPTACWSGP